MSKSSHNNHSNQTYSTSNNTTDPNTSPLNKKQQRKCKDDLYKQSQNCYKNFMRKIDSTVILHGSFNNGSYSQDSDIDLITKIPLYKIHQLILDQNSKRKTDQIVVTYLNNIKMPRLILFDSYYGFKLDIININDNSFLIKDKIIKMILEQDKSDILLKCIYRIKKWRSQQEYLMEPSKGYPNSQIFQIILFYISMKMKLLPFLNNHYEFDYEDFTLNTNITVNYVINSFMRFLSIIDNQEVVDLRNEYVEYSKEPWCVIEPSTKKPFNSMTKEVPYNISICALNYLKYKSFEECAQNINITKKQIMDKEKHINQNKAYINNINNNYNYVNKNYLKKNNVYDNYYENQIDQSNYINININLNNTYTDYNNHTPSTSTNTKLTLNCNKSNSIEDVNISTRIVDNINNSNYNSNSVNINDNNDNDSLQCSKSNGLTEENVKLINSSRSREVSQRENKEKDKEKDKDTQRDEDKFDIRDCMLDFLEQSNTAGIKSDSSQSEKSEKHSASTDCTFIIKDNDNDNCSIKINNNVISNMNDNKNEKNDNKKGNNNNNKNDNNNNEKSEKKVNNYIYCREYKANN